MFFIKSWFLGIRTQQQEGAPSVTSPLMSLSTHLIPHGRLFVPAGPHEQAGQWEPGLIPGLAS